MESRTLVRVGFISTLLAAICKGLSLGTPYWLESWHRLGSRNFEKAGLWEFCFNSFMTPMDPKLVSYVGCWWVFSPYYYGIRSFLMPPWFIVCQWVSCLVMICLIVSLIVEVAHFCKIFRARMTLVALRGIWALLLVTAFLEFGVIMVFGVAFKYDKYWVHRVEHSFLSWSYGLAVLSVIFALIAMILFIITAKNFKRKGKHHQEPIDQVLTKTYH